MALFIPLCVLISSVNADNQKIKFLYHNQTYISTKQDQIFFSRNENYKNELSKFFEEKTKDNEKLKNYDIYIYFYYYNPIYVSGWSATFEYMKYLAEKITKKRT